MESIKKATFGAGCFWGVEARFQRLPGVVRTSVGYSGGTTANPTYRQVCSGTTGHVEVVEVDFDPTHICYETLLEHFWEGHDPTTRNRQGPDWGTQYRSVIFFHDAEQEASARASKVALEREGRFRDSIVTEIRAAQPFYRAEEYHQQYLEKRGKASCHTS